MKAESPTTDCASLGYTEEIGPSTFWVGISLGDGRYHDERKGYGTFSPDGKSITWDTWRPPTLREINDREFAAWWRKTDLQRWADSEWARWYDGWYTKQCTKLGTTPEGVRQTLLDVIQSVSPMRFE